MILAILFSFIGLGVIATTLHKMTINALPLFAALTAGSAAYHAGMDLLETVLIAFAAGSIIFGVVDALVQPSIHPTIRTLVRALYAAPACAVAWFMTLAVARVTHLSNGAAILLAGFGVLRGALWARIVGITMALVSPSRR